MSNVYRINPNGRVYKKFSGKQEHDVREMTSEYIGEVREFDDNYPLNKQTWDRLVVLKQKSDLAKIKDASERNDREKIRELFQKSSFNFNLPIIPELISLMDADILRQYFENASPERLNFDQPMLSVIASMYDADIMQIYLNSIPREKIDLQDYKNAYIIALSPLIELNTKEIPPTSENIKTRDNGIEIARLLVNIDPNFLLANIPYTRPEYIKFIIDSTTPVASLNFNFKLPKPTRKQSVRKPRY